jgi:hypothetical protein
LNILKNLKYYFEPTFEACQLSLKNNDFQNSMIYLKISISLIDNKTDDQIVKKFIKKKLKLFENDSEKFNVLTEMENFRIDFLNYFHIDD